MVSSEACRLLITFAGIDVTIITPPSSKIKQKSAKWDKNFATFLCFLLTWSRSQIVSEQACSDTIRAEERERQRDCVSTCARVSAYASEREGVCVCKGERERESGKPKA